MTENYPTHEEMLEIAAERELINQCGYDNFNIDGDHGLLVVNIRDIIGIVEVLEEM